MQVKGLETIHLPEFNVPDNDRIVQARGAVIGLVLLAPALFSFVLERQAAQRQDSVLNARSQVLQIKPNRWRDGALACGTLIVLGLVGALLAKAVAASGLGSSPSGTARLRVSGAITTRLARVMGPSLKDSNSFAVLMEVTSG